MKKLAVCVGINDYPGTGSDLAGCVNDANDWEAELKRRGFTVAKLLDKQATKAGIRDALKNAIRKAGSGDVVVFTYSGHGSWQPDNDGDEADGRDEGWVPHDFKSNGLFLDDELFDVFEAVAAGTRVVMLSDSCHSGTVSRMAPIGAGMGAPTKIRFLPPEKFLSRKELARADLIAQSRRTATKPLRCLLISGCQDPEYSYDAVFGGRANGAFTYVALQTLKKLKSGATYVDWHKAIRAKLPTSAYPQRPNLSGTAKQKKWPVLS